MLQFRRNSETCAAVTVHTHANTGLYYDDFGQALSCQSEGGVGWIIGAWMQFLFCADDQDTV